MVTSERWVVAESLPYDGSPWVWLANHPPFSSCWELWPQVCLHVSSDASLLSTGDLLPIITWLCQCPDKERMSLRAVRDHLAHLGLGERGL